MKEDLQLIVMLTHNDKTVSNAYEIFESCKDSKAKIFGVKEKGIPFDEMKSLFSYMKQCGKMTVLEVVAYDEDECLNGAKMAAECGCDMLMGTMFFDSVNEFCKKHSLKYLPFVGNVKGCPSVLSGNIDNMIVEAGRYMEKGVFGFDLLGYRYTGDAKALNKKFVSQINMPVCIAGSINSYDRLEELKEISPWAFTIGGAFFENKFGKDFKEQIDNVYDYVMSKTYVKL